jgi:hypothetical protein
MNPRVVAVRPKTGYLLEITFTNGEVGTYDCRPLLDVGVFKELKAEAYFRQVKAEAGTVAWPHEQDICPDTLYMDSKKRRPRALPTRKRRQTALCRR